MRSILVFADHAPGMANRLETALALARVGSGHVSLMIDTPVARYVAIDPLGSSWLAIDAIDAALARDDAYAQSLTERLEREDVPFDILRCEDEPVDALGLAALLADVIVLSRDCDFAGQIAVTARAPVLLVPDDRAVAMPIARACIAWDGGDEAAGALRSALPLLVHGADVHVLTVEEKPGGLPATEVLRYLSRHGVKAELVPLARDGSIAETLELAAARHEADLLVMGAFGHSRLREFLFGGVTQHFLHSKTAPALLLGR